MDESEQGGKLPQDRRETPATLWSAQIVQTCGTVIAMVTMESRGGIFSVPEGLRG